ncbi:spore gernimation protein GerPD [Paenibacillus sp. EC2-1]|uniref:spore gernimation protein GerPD n=1 Tax=Paenibacillus sp. EC2-1 TaxID=3388665 RepID=UPI003BEEFDBE
MKLNVVNKALSVGEIKVLSISSSSVFLVGDTQFINCSSLFDTPPDSLIPSAEPSMDQQSSLEPKQQS